jgi:NitT/TauT family transport system substrate-binding protein
LKIEEKKMIDRRKVLARLGLLAVGGITGLPRLAGAAQPAVQQAGQKVDQNAGRRVGQVVAGSPAHIINYLPHMVGVAGKFMHEEGLDFRLISSDGGTKLRDLVAAGHINFGLGDSTHPIQLANRGRPAKILMAIDNRCPYTNVVVRHDLYEKGITTLDALADYRRANNTKPIVAVSTIGGGQYVYASYLFEKMGAANKLHWVSGGVTLTMLGGLRTAQFDAIIAPHAWQFEAERAGYGKTIFDVSDAASWDRYFGGPMPVTCAYALQSTIDNHPEIVQAYVNGMVRAMKWIERTPEHGIWEAVGKDHLKETRPDTALKELTAFKSTASYGGDFDAASFANGAPIWFRPSTGMKKIGYAEMADLSFLDTAKRKFG